jgi:hypothetical protein
MSGRPSPPGMFISGIIPEPILGMIGCGGRGNKDAAESEIVLQRSVNEE